MRQTTPATATRTIPLSAPDLTERERAYLLEAFDSTWISSIGPFVERFERAFARFAGVEEAVSCVNGTAALHLALLALGIGPGDEVILPDVTYIATANAVRYVGATPVLADCDPHTWTLDPASVERLMTARTRALIVVHLFGVPCDLGPLTALAKRHGAAVIEDASEAHGALYEGEPVGSWGDVATFSFYGNKILTTGEGGMICTDDPAIATRLRKLRGQGADPEHPYWFDEVGYNYRMTNLACAIGLAQLERFEELRQKRSMIATWYLQMAERFEAPLIMQRPTPSSRPAPWIVGALVDQDAGIERNALRAKLSASGIETRPFFCPIHRLGMYQDAPNDRGCPVSTDLGERGIMLPTHTQMTRDDVSTVVEEVCAAAPRLERTQ